MKFPVNVPQLTETMEEATVTKWYKAAGDPIQKKEIPYQVETDKSTMDVESVTRAWSVKCWCPRLAKNADDAPPPGLFEARASASIFSDGLTAPRHSWHGGGPPAGGARSPESWPTTCVSSSTCAVISLS